jgi:hypothetical protein
MKLTGQPAELAGIGAPIRTAMPTDEYTALSAGAEIAAVH